MFKGINKYASISLSIFILIVACKNVPDSGVWPPDTSKDRPNPTIQSVDPPDSVYSGEGILTITGTNFSSNPNENHVYFNAVEGSVLEATETQLKVKVPNILDMKTAEEDTVVMKLRVDGAILYAKYQDSYEYILKFKNLALEYGGFDDNFNLSAIACNKTETLYLTSDRTVYEVKKDSIKKEFTQLLAVSARSMKAGPGGYLYYVQETAMFRIPPEGGTDAAWYVVFPSPVYDIDFDSHGNVYAAGKKGIVYHVDIETKAKTVTAVYDSIEIVAVRVYDNAVYLAGNYIGEAPPSSTPWVGVWKNNIVTQDSLEANELAVNWDEYTNNDGSHITALAFSDEGEMILAADMERALSIQHPDGTIEPFYSRVLFPPTYKMVWGEAQWLYLVGTTAEGKIRLIRVNMLDRKSAPYYGRE